MTAQLDITLIMGAPSAPGYRLEIEANQRPSKARFEAARHRNTWRIRSLSANRTSCC